MYGAVAVMSDFEINLLHFSVVIVVAVFVIVLSALITAINRQYLNTTPFVSFTRLFRFVVFCFDFVKPLPN